MKRLIIGGLILLFLAGCGKANLEPRAIEPEVDTCVICNMGISHEEYATQIILENGDDYIFDDIGCMIEYMEETDEKIAVSYVKDSVSDEWIKMDEAFYVFDDSFWTPMSYGVLSFKEEQAALDHLKKEGTGKQLTEKELHTHKWGVPSHE